MLHHHGQGWFLYFKYDASCFIYIVWTTYACFKKLLDAMFQGNLFFGFIYINHIKSDLHPAPFIVQHTDFTKGILAVQPDIKV
ncbi:hypothetical protein JM66_03415 [Aeromonas bestiarum]|nr:hypothetical protein JM66_03415 [Aeromonas bestiarum]